MEVTINVMFEGNGNYWISVLLRNGACTGVFDTENYVEFNYDKSMRMALHKAAQLRRVLGTGQELVDKDELQCLVTKEAVTQEQLDEAYEDVIIMF